MARSAAALLLIAVVGVECSARSLPPADEATSGAGSGAAPFTGRRLVSIAVMQERQPVALFDDVDIRLDFSGDGGQPFHASVGCNHIDGTPEYSATHLSFDGLSITEGACEPDRGAHERWLLDFLSDDPGWQKGGDLITLCAGDRVVVLTDRGEHLTASAGDALTWC